MNHLFVVSLLFCSTMVVAQTTYETQISAAVKAAPEEDKAGATVMGYDDTGDFRIIRKGTNKMICLTDDPTKEGFDVACYHQDLEPFMARGRALKREGKSYQEIDEIREKEAKSGKLKMTKNPATLHILNGKTEEDATYRWVVYIPFATAASTGLPLKPIIPGAPWLMNPGSHRAHIMISPPN